MNKLPAFLSFLFDGYWPTGAANDDLPVCLESQQCHYTRRQLLAAGDVADVYTAAADAPHIPMQTPCLLKVPRVPEGRAHLDAERKTLSKLWAITGRTTYGRYLPTLVESFAPAGLLGGRINVFRFETGFHTFEQVHEQHPALDGVHLAWMFNRLLTVLGFCHRQSIVHGAVLPCHALIDAGSHGLRLVGWGQSAAIGRSIAAVPARYWDWYPPEVHNKQPVGPATDLFLAARCIVYLAGGDPVTNWMPETVPLSFQRFLSACLLESVHMRPDDAWALQDDFDRLLRILYGPPKFHELTLT
jgi:hypothetical protein